MIEIFHKGGPIMWPLLALSVVVLSVVIERFLFIVIERKNRDERLVGEILAQIDKGHLDQASRIGGESKDFVARALTYALAHREKSFSEAMLRAANWELKRFHRGLTILDTAITLAPLLGLLGTVTGMIRSFDMLGGSELGAPSAITGGIAEALIATAYGLGIAITGLLPFNFLNSREEEARLEIQDAASHVELHLKS
jgi:biopolymer transport protein ExbB